MSQPITRLARAHPVGALSVLAALSLLFPVGSLEGQADAEEGGELSVSGAVDIPPQPLSASLLSATPIGDGMCQLRLQVNVEGDVGIGFQVILPGGLKRGIYPVGPTHQDAGMWDAESASPGTFTATAALDRAYDPPERRLFGFWSIEGEFWVEHFDGERLEASFAVELQERTVRSATPPPYFIDVQGQVAQDVGRDVFGGITGSGFGGFYLCEVSPPGGPGSG